MHYVYIAECNDGSYYTGYTSNIEKRIKAHNEGKGAKYTRGRIPVKLIYCEDCMTKSEALKREHQIKKLNKKQKIQLVKDGRK